MSTKLVIALRGVPGSGKTTLAEELKKNLGFTHISSDNRGLKAWRIYLQQALERGDEYIVIDRCHSTYQQRMSSTRILEPFNSKVKTVLATLSMQPYVELEKRISLDSGHRYEYPERRIALRAHLKDRSNDFISSEENWDSLIYLKENTLQELKENLESLC